MYSLIITALLFLALIIALIQTISFKFCITNEFELVIDYSFFALYIKSDKKKPKRKSTISKKDIFLSAIQPLKTLLPRSDFSINNICFSKNNLSITSYSHLCGIAFACLAPLFAVTESYPDSFKIVQASDKPLKLDFYIECRLYIFIFASLIFLFEILKRRIDKCRITK